MLATMSPPSSSPPPTGRDTTTLIAFLGALSMFFATLEYLVPKPVPFLRLGLANIPLLLALDLLAPLQLLGLVAIKVLGQALVNGTLASYVFLFSLAGSTGSILVMVTAHRLGGRLISLAGVGTAGAGASNLVQLWLSVHFIFGPPARAMAPVFLAVGTISGLAVGFLAQYFHDHSRWYRQLPRRRRRNEGNRG